MGKKILKISMCVCFYYCISISYGWSQNQDQFENERLVVSDTLQDTIRFMPTAFPEVFLNIPRNFNYNIQLVNIDSLCWIENRKPAIRFFDLMYHLPKYNSIGYKSEYLSNYLFSETIVDRITKENQLFYPFQCYGKEMFYDRLNDSLLIYNPSLVKYQWNKIESPNKLIVEGVLLNTKTAHDIFHLDNMEAIKRLKKPVETIYYWRYGGVETLQFSQIFFSNWVKGGENSVSLLSDFRVFANFKKPKMAWDNKATHKLGFVTSESDKSRISDDLIELNSKFGLNASEKWYYSSLFDFKTQFFYGRDTKIREKILSGFMSPAYLTFAIGMDYKQSKDFTLLLSPITAKITMVLDTVNIDQTKYSIANDKRSITKSGLSLNNFLRWKISEEVSIMSTIEYFYGYLDPIPQTQMNWELITDFRINKYLSARLYNYFRYYENESGKLQYKENLSLAFSYKF